MTTAEPTGASKDHKAPKMTMAEFLATYDITRYPRPSVTVDDVILAFDGESSVSVLLVKRGRQPYEGLWALPGGFVASGPTPADRESPEAAVAREVLEETGIAAAWSEQLFTYGDVDRDPRGHVISIAYVSAIPTALISSMHPEGGDDASDARWFRVDSTRPSLSLTSDDVSISEDDLAFDHARIIRDAILRVAGKLGWTNVATRFVGDGNTFTIPQLRKFHETMLSLQTGHDVRLDPGNFHRDIQSLVRPINTKTTGPHGATLYQRADD